MAASASDLFQKLGGASSLVNSPKVTSVRSPGVTTLAVDNCNWDTTTGKIFATYKVDTSNNVIAGSQIIWQGVVTGTTAIGSMTRLSGASDTGSAIGDVVELLPASAWANNMVTGLLSAGLTQAGGMGAISPTSVTSSGTVTAANFVQTGGASANGWTVGLTVPNTVTALGNRSYSLVANGTDLTSQITPGMRLKMTRTVTAPTQCTSLNGTTQFYSKTSPAGMTFTNNFVVSAWIKLAAYNSGANQVISSRYNGTSGWAFRITAAGQVALVGLNGGSGNSLTSQSYQSVPLNKWVHVGAQLDMTTTSTGGTNNYILIDGVEVPNTAVRAGTSPTALIQAGNLEIGSNNGGTETFNGKIAQVAIYSAKVTEATILASMHQTLVGTETSLISAYSFSNSINDLNANANNLTANGSAVATNADTPFGQTYSLTGYTNGTLCYGIVTSVVFSTNTTITVQVPEGDTIPTTGGVSAVSYSTQKVPYGFPADKGKWDVLSLFRTQTNTTSNATYGSFSSNGFALTVPVGAWAIGYDLPTFTGVTTGMSWNISPISIIGSTLGAEDINFTKTTVAAVASLTFIPLYLRIPKNVLSSATYVLYTLGATTSPGIDGDNQLAQIIAEFNLL